MAAVQRNATEEEANKETMRGLFKAFREGWMDWVDEFISDDHIHHSVLGPPPGRRGSSSSSRCWAPPSPT